MQIWQHELKLIFFVKYSLSSAGHSLSIICIEGYSPLCFRYSCILVVAHSSSWSDLDVNASAKIVLVSWLYTTMMYFAPCSTFWEIYLIGQKKVAAHLHTLYCHLVLSDIIN